MRPVAVFCADIGSIARSRFGWAGGIVGGHLRSGDSIGDLAIEVSKTLSADIPTALGLECPLFVPVDLDPHRLTSSRHGEGGRAWCAGAGAGALATGLSQTVWILRAIRATVPEGIPAFLSWSRFRAAGHGLLIWEAFVTGSIERTHVGDAEAAVREFMRALPNPERANAVTADTVHSLAGAALLRTGWSTDLNLLAQRCLVLKASPI